MWGDQAGDDRAIAPEADIAAIGTRTVFPEETPTTAAVGTKSRRKLSRASSSGVVRRGQASAVRLPNLTHAQATSGLLESNGPSSVELVLYTHHHELIADEI
jgi:hypothetical protein